MLHGFGVSPEQRPATNLSQVYVPQMQGHYWSEGQFESQVVDSALILTRTRTDGRVASSALGASASFRNFLEGLCDLDSLAHSARAQPRAMSSVRDSTQRSNTCSES
jgi:hypothetical protein